MKKIILRIIITLLLLLLIFFTSFMMPYLSLLLAIFLIIVEILFNKIIDKLGLFKTLIVSLVPVIIFIIFIFIVSISTRIETLKEWNKIKNDYEIINEIANNYYEENLNTRGGDNKVIVLDINDDLSKLIDYGEPLKDDSIYINLNEKQQKALENISQYYTNQDFIRIDKNQIEYTDDTGYFAIIYLKGKKLEGWNNSSLKKLTDNWYKYYTW